MLFFVPFKSPSNFGAICLSMEVQQLEQKRPSTYSVVIMMAGQDVLVTVAAASHSKG
jgi:hypothetical protein